MSSEGAVRKFGEDALAQAHAEGLGLGPLLLIMSIYKRTWQV